MFWSTRILAVLLVLACGDSSRAGFFSGRVVGHFANPDYTGSIRGVGSFDNTSTAHVFGLNTASLGWGAAPGHSLLNFFPNQDVEVFSDETFDLGTVTFSNGTSALESLIFGIDLVLNFVDDFGQTVDTKIIPVGISTTNNSITGGFESADRISFSGAAAPFSVFEGFAATVKLRGAIIGDPYFDDLRGLVLVPEFGFYGGEPTMPAMNPFDPSLGPDLFPLFTSLAADPVPEPSSMVLLGIGALATLGAGRRRRNSARETSPAGES